MLLFFSVCVALAGCTVSEDGQPGDAQSHREGRGQNEYEIEYRDSIDWKGLAAKLRDVTYTLWDFAQGYEGDLGTLPPHRIEYDRLDLERATGEKLSIIVEGPVSSADVAKLIIKQLGARDDGPVAISVRIGLAMLEDESASFLGEPPQQAVFYLHIPGYPEVFCIPYKVNVTNLILDAGAEDAIPKCDDVATGNPW